MTHANMDERLPLEGVRVIDFGHYIAGPMAAMILADQGAEVIHIDPPEGPVYDGPQDSILNRGKKRVVLDLKSKEGQSAARDLIASADIVIENFRTGVMARLGLGAEWAREINSRVVYVSVPGFPSDDPVRANWRGLETALCAATSFYMDNSYRKIVAEGDPVFTAMPMTSFYAAIDAAIAATVGLYRAKKTGRGAHVEVSLFAAGMSPFGVMSMDFAEMPARYDTVAEAPAETVGKAIKALRDSGNKEAAVELFKKWQTPITRKYECSDGRYIVFICDGNWVQIDRFVDVLGLEDFVADLGLRRIDPYEDIGCDGTVLYNSEHWSLATREALTAKLREIFAQRPSSEWEKIFAEAHLPATAEYNTEEFVNAEWTRQSGIVCEVETPEYGPMLQPGRIFHMPNRGAYQQAPKPHERLDAAALPAMARRTEEHGGADALSNGADVSNAGPLAGVRVLDLSIVYAGPIGGRTLAECGADVIKIDRPKPGHTPDTPCIAGVDLNRGKRSIVFDLQESLGKETFERLVKSADVVLFNGTDEMLEKLGISYEQLKSINERIILCQVSAYSGPAPSERQNWRGYDQLAQGASGLSWRFNNVRDEHYLLHGEASCLDSSTGYIAALAVITALVERESTNIGSWVRASLSSSAANVQLPYCYDYKGRGAWDEPSGQSAVGWDAGNRIYPSSDGWVAIGTLEGDRHKLATLMGVDAADEADDAVFAARLEEAFAKLGSAHWETALNAQGIACHRLKTLEQIRQTYVREGLEPQNAGTAVDPALLAFASFDYPFGSRVELLAPAWIRGDFGLRMGRPIENYGEEREAVLRDAGYSEREVASILNSGQFPIGFGRSGKPLPL
ncbi:MAG: CoA transferase [Pseudomonadota bacterium]